MSTHQGIVTDPTTKALSYLEAADDHAASARQARDLGDSTLNRRAEFHAVAGRFREEERLCLQRAKILAEIAQAQALEHVADSARRMGLAL